MYEHWKTHGKPRNLTILWRGSDTIDPVNDKIVQDCFANKSIKNIKFDPYNPWEFNIKTKTGGPNSLADIVNKPSILDWEKAARIVLGALQRFKAKKLF